MKKTRFFYGIHYFLLVFLGWLLLFYKAVEVNQGRTQEKEEKHNAAEKVLGESVSGENVSEEGVPEKNAERKIIPAEKFLAGRAWGERLSKKNAPKEEMSENKIQQESSDPEIRVLLMDSDYQSYYHDSVTVCTDGEEIVYTKEKMEKQQNPVILEAKNGEIQIPSIKRQDNPPSYKGKVEIRFTPKGLLVVNTLPLETYLEKVVPSEMPSSYETAALMAQAVCARTYAVCQMENSTLKEEYDADVDDSVNYQVYGNFNSTARTNQAVRNTRGQILCQNGKPVTAYYFSTSAGVTSTDEIWGVEAESPYLKSVECTFDQDSPWSSWQVEIPWKNLEESSASFGCEGTLKDLQINKKESSGAVTGMKIMTEKGSIQLSGEYDIRCFLSPRDQLITEKDGTAIPGGSLLPSAYFDLKICQGEKVMIRGAGYGHGVGMSQNGANEMAKEGYTWQEILYYFFKNVSIESAGRLAGVK